MNYLVTGASGHLGHQIVEHLIPKLQKDDHLFGLVHRPRPADNIEYRPADFMDLDSLKRAFQKVNVLVYIPSKTYVTADRLQELKNVITAARDQHVDAIVAMSFIADQANNPFVMAPFYHQMPDLLAQSGLNYVILKDALYADPLVPYLPELIDRQAIIYPVGDQKMAFIAIDDCAEAFATAATNPTIRSSRQTYTLSQETAYTMPELAAIMSKVTGQTIGYQPVTTQEFGQIYAEDGDGDELASMYSGGAMGLLITVTNDFEFITGRKPIDMENFLKANYH
ncbi:NAD(P)H-binding protein [uncultured Limosilactobacillus sp.]|uniref:NmrA family NAD(P)-binding protein n=1 Tax=uncultured Limosilactobacillus sp. TaxID=2837629 RepID=UPI0026011018|nr:NAD(P)H-binding protein [uncultured Limosilactobacillus sp.]